MLSFVRLDRNPDFTPSVRIAQAIISAATESTLAFSNPKSRCFGVQELTIMNWGNESQPAVQYIPSIVRFLGYDPTGGMALVPSRLTAARRARRLTQRQFAAELGVDPGTIHKWKKGARML
jgi:hypothetical protein